VPQRGISLWGIDALAELGGMLIALDAAIGA
jgi:hypothetical protein